MRNPFRHGAGRHRAGDVEGLGGPDYSPPSKSVQSLAAVALVIIAIATVAVVGWLALVEGDDASTALMGSLATGAMGALIVLAGGRHNGPDN